MRSHMVQLRAAQSVAGGPVSDNTAAEMRAGQKKREPVAVGTLRKPGGADCLSFCET